LDFHGSEHRGFLEVRLGMVRLDGGAFGRLFLFGLLALCVLHRPAAAQCSPVYLSASGPIQTGSCGPVIYNGLAPANLTLPLINWSGTVIDEGPGQVTLIGPGNSPVNGAKAGVAMVVGSGGTVSGDPSGGWAYSGPTSNVSGGTSGNPSATAGPVAVNGSASTYMRSDAAPAVQAGSASQEGILEVGGGLSGSGTVQLAQVGATSHEWFSSVSSAGALTPTQPGFGDLSGTATTGQLPTSGTWGFSGTFSGTPTFSGVPNFTGSLTGTQVSCVGLSSGNALVSSSGACDPSGSANQVVATPNGSSGASALRALVPADLPLATVNQFGAVQPDDATLGFSAGGLLQLIVTTISSAAASPAIVTGDYEDTVQLTNAAPAATIAEAGSSGFPAGWTATVCMTGGTGTIAPGGGTIQGQSSVTLQNGQCGSLLSDGVSNYGFAPSLPPRINFASSAATTFATSGGTITFPDATDTVDLLGTAQTISAQKFFTNSLGTVVQGDAAIGFDSTLGATLWGDNASGTCDTSIANASKQVALCVMQGTENIGIGNTTSPQNTGDILAMNGNTNGSRGVTIGNGNSGSSALSYLKLGTNSHSYQMQMLVNGSANTSGNGANSSTIIGYAGLWLAGTTGTNGLEIGSSGAATLYNQPTTGTITYAVCAAANANGTGGGAVILDASSTVCGLSDERDKLFTPFDGGLAEIMRLDPIQGTWKPGSPRYASDPGQHLWLGAWETGEIDPRLVGWNGKFPRAPRMDAMITLLTSGEQDLQNEILVLQQRLASVEGDAYGTR
jgi:hypothetical protein